MGLLRRCSDGDTDARETVILRFLPLAGRLARRYEGRGEPLEDLVQVATIGLIKAVDRYSPERGDSFIAFAQVMILGEVRRYFRDATWQLHVPRTAKEHARRVALAETRLRASGAPADTEAIAALLALTPAQVLEARRAWSAYRSGSLDALRRGPDGVRVAAREISAGGESDYDWIELVIGIDRALRGLGRRDQTVLLMRLCLELTQYEIAAQIGVSQMQVSRILRKINAAVAEACGLAA